jgi:hypothetical protein
MQIAIGLYPGFTALDAIGPYQVFAMHPGIEWFCALNPPANSRTTTGSCTLGSQARSPTYPPPTSFSFPERLSPPTSPRGTIDDLPAS